MTARLLELVRAPAPILPALALASSGCGISETAGSDHEAGHDLKASNVSAPLS